MAQLSERELEFLHESNAIEEITNIDYRQPALAVAGKGHVGAYLLVQDLVTRRALPALDQLLLAHRYLTEEQQQFGHELPQQGIGALRSPANRLDVRVGDHVAPGYATVPGLMDGFLADLARDLGPVLARPGMGAYSTVSLAGGYFQRFEDIHPFVDGNGRLGRLLANYIVLAGGHPLFVFRAAERPAFYPAHRSQAAMRSFFADKLREVIDCPSRCGDQAPRERSEDLDDYYQCPSCGAGKTMKWHDLIPLYLAGRVPTA